MNSAHLLIMLMIGAAALFLVSSVLVSTLYAVWIRIDSLSGDFRLSKRKIQAISSLQIIAFALFFSFFFSSATKVRAHNLEQINMNALREYSQETISNLLPHSNAFTAALANFNFQVLRYNNLRD